MKCDFEHGNMPHFVLVTNGIESGFRYANDGKLVKSRPSSYIQEVRSLSICAWLGCDRLLWAHRCTLFVRRLDSQALMGRTIFRRRRPAWEDERKLKIQTIAFSCTTIWRYGWKGVFNPEHSLNP